MRYVVWPEIVIGKIIDTQVLYDYPRNFYVSLIAHGMTGNHQCVVRYFP